MLSIVLAFVLLSGRITASAVIQIPLDNLEDSVNSNDGVLSDHCGPLQAFVADELPIVNLSYTRHQAASLDKLGLFDFYNFTSIRYGQDTSKTRFRAPLKPEPNTSDEVENGLKNQVKCPISAPQWMRNPEDQKKPPKCTPGHEDWENCECCEPGETGMDGACDETCHPRNSEDGEFHSQAFYIPGANDDWVAQSEDCLFLDVHVPKRIWENKENELRPVLVWIYGGAYTLGSKQGYQPDGLIDRSFAWNGVDAKEKGIVYVQMQYRMGAFGFAAGKTLEADGEANVGLMDQRLALEWVKEHISKFGGDPDNITIFGQSAGGGSVIHQLTAYGEKPETPLFKRAYSMSGGWPPLTKDEQADEPFKKFMEYAKADSLDDLRGKTTERLILANRHLIWGARTGSFMFGPVSWGSFTPQSPSKLLQDPSRYASDTEVMASSVRDEGGMFAKALVREGYTFDSFLKENFPYAKPDEMEWIRETYGGTIESEELEISHVIADALFRCQNVYLTDAYDGELYRHVWEVGFSSLSYGHGGDMLYAFWKGRTDWGASEKSAKVLQDYILWFAMYGKPETKVKNFFGKDFPAHQKVNENGRVMVFDNILDEARMTLVDVTSAVDPEICRTWVSDQLVEGFLNLKLVLTIARPWKYSKAFHSHS